jgi:hypothetical protein
MEKDLTPYEQSLTLKDELGFNEPCFVTFDDNKDFEIQDFEQTYDTLPSHMIASPLKSQVFRWFREKYNLMSVIGYHNIWKYSFLIQTIEEHKTIIVIDKIDTYEEAELACIDKLIELVKNK